MMMTSLIVRRNNGISPFFLSVFLIIQRGLDVLLALADTDRFAYLFCFANHGNEIINSLTDYNIFHHHGYLTIKNTNIYFSGKSL